MTAEQNKPTEGKTVKYVDSTHVVVDLLSDIANTTAEAKKVAEQQQYLLDSVKEKKDFEEKLPGFAKSMDSQMEQLKESIRRNDYRADCLNNVLIIAQNNEPVKFAISMLLEGLGIVNKECVDYEHRAELKTETNLTEGK